jgi:hypothetical protein
VTVSLPLVSAPRAALAAAQTPEGLEAAKTSRLVTTLALPEGAFRVTGNEQITQISDGLNNMAQLNKGRVSRVEVVIWRGGDAPKRALPGLLKKAGYTYAPLHTAENDAGKATLFTSVRDNKKSELLGLWMERNSSILLAWGAFTRDGGAAAATPTDNDDAPAAADDDSSATDVPPPASKASRHSGGGEENAENAPANAIVHNVGDDRFETEVVNVMGRAMPKVPAFPKLAPKPGVIRGYVYDTKGRPLKNAVIGVRASLFTGASGKTDAKGYYEITPPLMATEFYKAAYPMDYGDGRAVLGLHPADGEADLDSAKVGTVENFVMMPYGIGDRAGVQDRPHYSGNYYGGSLSLGWYADEDPRFPDATKLPPDGTIEITLTPDGPLVDGSPARPIIIRKLVGRSVNTGMYVHNIPIGAYKMTARLVGGGPLKMQEIGPASRAFGISPKTATGAADLLLRPSTADPDMAMKPGQGNWDSVTLRLERP